MEEQATKQQLKKLYALDDIFFYKKGKQYFCFYKTNDSNRNFDLTSIAELDFLLKSLAMQQAKIYFDDINKEIYGMDELQQSYLIFKLSGL